MGSSICVGCGVGGPCGWRQQTGLFQQSEKVPFHRTKPSAGDGLSRNQDQVDRFEQLPAMKPEALAHHSASLISDGGLANPTAGDHPETGRGLRRKCLPICQKTALGQALTVFPVGPEIRAGLDTAGLWKNRSLAGGRHGCRKGLGGSESCPAACAATGQNLATCLGGHTCAETVPAFASDVRRLECLFHLNLKKSSQ